MQNNKLIPIIIGVVLVLAIAGFAYMQSKPAEQTGAPTGSSDTVSTTTPSGDEPGPMPPGPATTTPGPTAYTMAQVALHASTASCWTVIRGSVYNLTTWISRHPGGQQAILKLCGTDGTAEFEGQHGGSAPQENMLASFKIGVLAQ